MRIKEGTKDGLLDGYLDGILLGAEPGNCDGYILGSDDGLSLGPWQHIALVCSDLGAIDDNPLVCNAIHLVDQNVLKMTLMMVYMMDNQIVYYQVPNLVLFVGDIL